ncbi:MAG: YqaJ viral recombinase family protein, partial [Aeromonas sp.]
MNAAVDTMTFHQQHQAYCDRLLAGIDQTTLSTDEQWHLRRRLGIGGSEIGTLLGLNKYQTPFDLWLVKTGRKIPDDLSDNPAIHWGHKLEAVVADEYAERTKQPVTVDETHYRADVAPWLVGNVDRMVGDHKVLECKTAGGFAAKKAGFGKGNVYGPDGELVIACDEVPDTYLLQCQHYMLVTGRQEADLAVLIDGRDYRIYSIPRNEAVIAEIVAAATEFWFDRVLADVPPEGCNLIGTLDATDAEDEVEADSDMMELLAIRNGIVEA